MLTVIEQMIYQKKASSKDEIKAILREIIQSIILISLSRTGFFENASFYGGTALRVFYGLNRYSEDLDFTLNTKNENFTIDQYKDKIKELALSYGLELEVETKEKKIITPIESAFIKINTFQTFINLKIKNEITNMLHKNEVIKVKFEIDCNPSIGFNVETKWIDIPEYAPIIVLDEPSLFAWKIHAILCRNYKNTVKGRDYYDFLFFISKRIKPNLIYLRNKLIESSKLNVDDIFTIDVLKEILQERFELVDFKQVKQDAMKFVSKNEDLSFYCKDLFIQMIEKI